MLLNFGQYSFDVIVSKRNNRQFIFLHELFSEFVANFDQMDFKLINQSNFWRNLQIFQSDQTGKEKLSKDENKIIGQR